MAGWACSRIPARLSSDDFANGIRAYFSRVGAITKYETAQAIARQLPELEPWLPPPRKIWMSEDPRLSIFDAVALVFMFFYSDPGPGSTAAAKGRHR